MKKKLKGSYTVEAALVMAIVLWALLFSVQAAYRLRDETAGAMALEEAVQRLCHNESERIEDAPLWASQRAGFPFSWKNYEFEVRLSGNSITGRSVKASGIGGSWSLEMEHDVFDPENFLRLISLIDREE